MPKQSLSVRHRRALHVLGFLFLRMGQFARAKRLFAALTALDPGDIHARCSLALASIQLEDGEGAYNALIGLAPGDPIPGGDATLFLLQAQAHRLLGEDLAAREAAAAFWKTRSQSNTER